MDKSLQIERLLELKKLYESGILTKDEMEVEKQKILGRYKPTQNTQQEAEKLSERIETNVATFVLTEDEEDEEDSSFRRNHWMVFSGILIGLVGIYFLFSRVILPSHDAVDENNNATMSLEKAQNQLAIKGYVNDNIEFTMHLVFKDDEIEGTEHYSSQKTDAILRIRGIRKDRTMTLKEFDGQSEAGRFEGEFSGSDYRGTFINPKGKKMPFFAVVMSEEELIRKEKAVESAIKEISEYGIVIGNTDKKVYYLSKEQPEYGGYESEGENSGKIYIYDIADKRTTYETILIPSGENYSIMDYKYSYPNITFILYDVGRNGFGIGNYCTEISQFNIYINKWRDIAEGCARAEFIENGKKIKVTFAEITNYDEAECAVDYQYKYTEEIIKL